jgi:protein involved in polysaccharide export with SLBB domain
MPDPERSKAADPVATNAPPLAQRDRKQDPGLVDASVRRGHGECSTNGANVVLRPGLVLRIDVYVLGKREIEEPLRRIGENGEVTLPLLGVVKVTEYDMDGMANELHRRYSQYFVNPQVVVEFVTDQNIGGGMPWGYVTVLGRVKKSGRVSIPATRDLTVSAAIQGAGGLDTSAKDTAIRLTRIGDDGKTQSQEVNLRAVGARGELAGDLVLRSGDVIYVPELVF